MIESFAHKGIEAFYLDGTMRGVQAKHAPKLGRILDQLEAARDVKDMDTPGFALHALKGDRKGYWAVKVSGNWRIIFRFEDGRAFDVNSLDYH